MSMDEVWVALAATALLVVALCWLGWWLVADSRWERRQALAAAHEAERFRALRRDNQPSSRPNKASAKVSVAELLERAIRERQATPVNWPSEDPDKTGRIRPYAQDQFPTTELPKTRITRAEHERTGIVTEVVRYDDTLIHTRER